MPTEVLGWCAALAGLATLFGFLNERFFRLPTTIGIMVIAVLISMVLLVINPWVPGIDLHILAQRALTAIDFPHALLNIVLSFLLFAASLQVDLEQLWARKFSVLTLALIGTLLAVALFSVSMWFVFPLLGINMPFVWCVVLGAVLAPTDPVSVVGMLRRMGLPAPLQAIFTGESLFNDGIGVLAFGVALDFITGQGASGGSVFWRFVLEALGSGFFGVLMGWFAVRFMRRTHDSHLELLASLTLAAGTYSLAGVLHMSGPIATVAAGLMLSTGAAQRAISRRGKRDIYAFWTLSDEILNAMLFLLIGFQIFALTFQFSYFVAALVAIPFSIVVRAMSVFLASLPFLVREPDRVGMLAVMTWGGLRGGISISLALSLPDAPERAPLLAVCYGVVVFTIIAQGLTIERVARRFYHSE
ncbi:sodium:proton antiporter [Kozakia baliensis]|uniref:cation:proton antiporter n=1 Tax=Kozakia baliensis TaxID=153496 RepID=UPI00345C4895